MKKAKERAGKIGQAEARKLAALRSIESGDHSDEAFEELKVAAMEHQEAMALPAHFDCLVCLDEYDPDKQRRHAVLGLASVFVHVKGEASISAENGAESPDRIGVCEKCLTKGREERLIPRV